MKKNHYHALIIATSVIYTIWYFLPRYWLALYDAEILKMLMLNGYGAPIKIDSPVFLVIGILYFAARNSLLTSWCLARYFFLVMVLLGGLSLLAAGVSVLPPLDSLIGYIVVISDGVILAMAFKLNVKEK